MKKTMRVQKALVLGLAAVAMMVMSAQVNPAQARTVHRMQAARHISPIDLPRDPQLITVDVLRMEGGGSWWGPAMMWTYRMGGPLVLMTYRMSGPLVLWTYRAR